MPDSEHQPDPVESHAVRPIRAMAVCGFGLERVVAGELHRLGFEDAKPAETGCVRWQTDLAGVARANLWLRTADRVLIVIDEFEAVDFEVLFERTRALPWSDWIPADGAFPVRARCVRSQLTSVPAVTRAVKRAVVDSLLRGHASADLPESGATHGIQARLLNNTLSLLLDTSGRALHKRGYRPESGQAPLRESLAAGLLLLSRWRPGRALVDPFCGSGTIPIEAAMMAGNIAPGLLRRFDAEDWPTFPQGLWERVRREARASATDADDHRALLAGYDADASMLALARRNAERAGVGHLIHFQQRDVRDLAAKDTHGVVVSNPPYGVRLEDRQHAERVLRVLPSVFRTLPTWSFGIITDCERFEAIIGQDASKRRKLYNGSIQCTLYRFDGPKPHAGETTTQRAFGRLSSADEQRLDEFAAVLAKRWRHTRKWADRGTDAYRFYDRDVPAIAARVERAGDALTVSFESRLAAARSLAQHEEVVARVHERATQITGLPIARPGDRLRLQEHGVPHVAAVNDDGSSSFEIELREVRKWILDRAGNERVGSPEALGPSIQKILQVAGAASFNVTDSSAPDPEPQSFDLLLMMLGPDAESAARRIRLAERCLVTDGTALLLSRDRDAAPPQYAGWRISDATRRMRPEDCGDGFGLRCWLASRDRR